MYPNSLAVDGSDLYYSYNKKSSILNRLNIKVPKGVIYGLLGPSGCGKTTLLHCIVGRLKPKSGKILVFDKLPGQRGSNIPGKGVGFMPQELALYSDISIEETFNYFGGLFEMTSSSVKERTDFLIELLQIPDKKALIKNLSGGQKRRISFAVALIHEPPFIILDEPTVGVDPQLRQSIWKHLNLIATNYRTTIIVTTHYVEEARFAEMVGFMRNGNLLAEENPETLIEKYNAQTLEEVFLELCNKDMKSFDQTAYKGPLESITENGEEQEMQKLEVPNDTDNKIFRKNSQTSIALSYIRRKSITEDYSTLQQFYRRPSHLAFSNSRFRKVNALILKSLIDLRRSWLLSASHVILPILGIVCCSLFIGQPPSHLNLAVVNSETKGLSELFLEYIDTETIIQVPYTNLSLARNSVYKGKTFGVLHIGSCFTTCMVERFSEGNNSTEEIIANSSIILFLDRTDPHISLTILAAVSSALEMFSKNLTMFLPESISSILASPLLAVGDNIYGEDTNYTTFISSGMAVGVTSFMAIGLTALSIVVDKKQGLLDRSWIAGVTYAEVITSKLISMIFTMIIQVILVIAILIWGFDLVVKGSIFWLFICLFLSGVFGMATGLLISSVSKSENEAMMLSLGCFVPCFFLCGCTWPVESMNTYIKYTSYGLPLTLLLKAIRSLLTRGWSITHIHVFSGLLVCSTWIIGLLIICIISFRFRS